MCPGIVELLIDFWELIGQHSVENMAEAVWATMELYGLVGKVRSESSSFFIAEICINDLSICTR